MAVKCVVYLVGLAGIALLVMQLEKQDFDPGGESLSARILHSNRYLQIRHTFPRARRKNADCHYFNCFDIYKCGSHSGKLQVHIYPVAQYLDEDDNIIAISEEYKQILDAVFRSEFYTPHPDSACLFIPAIDTLSVERIEPGILEQMLASLPYWDFGHNHLIFSMIGGGSDLGLDKALLAGAGLTSLQYRLGFDVSIPFYVPDNLTNTGEIRNNSGVPLPPEQTNLENKVARPWRLLVMENSISDNITQRLRGSPGVLGVTRCGEAFCHLGNQHHLTTLLEQSRFCLICPASPLLASYYLTLALKHGCIPVIASDMLVLPFSEVLDWNLFSVRIRSVHLSSDELLMVVEQAEARLQDMAREAERAFTIHMSSPAAIATTTLNILNQRIYTQNIFPRQDWNLPDLKTSPLFLQRLPRPSNGFTAVILTYDRLESLFLLITKLSSVPSLSRILVVWNHQTIHPPPPDSWPKIHKTLKVVQTSQNKLSNRFFPYSEIETECVMSMDDDITMLTVDEIEFGYQVWREYPDRIVGFPSRTHYWRNSSLSWVYESEWKNDISLVLTGAAFYHKYWHYLYTASPSKEHRAIREWADSHVNCEDIAFNFLVANATGKPPVKVGPRKKFKCSTPSCENANMLSNNNEHLLERSQCMENFSRAYGGLPLMKVEYRADPVLYQESIPPSINKYKDIGSL